MVINQLIPSCVPTLYGSWMEISDSWGDSSRRNPLVMTNIAMKAMAHRNRWFTVLQMGGFSMAMLNNQMV